MKIYWTYSRTNLKPSEVHRHEKAPARLSNDKYHIGGLNRIPIFTHCICPKGYLHSFNNVSGEIHLAVIGGLDEDNCFRNTITSEQLLTLGNIARLYLSLGGNIEEGDFANFDLQLWLKAINK